MRHYELVIVLDPRLSQDDLAATTTAVEKLLGKGIVATDDLGLQNFFHHMTGKDGLDKGFMTSYHVTLESDDIDTIKTELGYNKNILRSEIFALKNADAFVLFEKNNEEAQKLAEDEEWSIKKRLTIFDDRSHDHLFNWKSTSLLKKFMTRFGDIKPRKYTGVSVAQQKKIRAAIIRSRTLGMLPFIK